MSERESLHGVGSVVSAHNRMVNMKPWQGQVTGIRGYRYEDGSFGLQPKRIAVTKESERLKKRGRMKYPSPM